MATYTSKLGKILNKITPDAPLSSTQKFNVEEKVLLWENSDTSSQFAGQTIPIANISDYAQFEVVTTMGIFLVKTDKVNMTAIDPADAVYYRHAIRVSTGIEFSASYYWRGYQNWNLLNVYLIPHYIYGIKNIGGGISPNRFIYLVLFSKERRQK